MHLIEKSFLDNLSVAKKSFLLLLVSSLGLLMLGALVALGLYNIKSDVDRIYRKPLEKVRILEQLKRGNSTTLLQQLDRFEQGHATGNKILQVVQNHSRRLNQTFGMLQNIDPNSAKRLSTEVLRLNRLLSESTTLVETGDTQRLFSEIKPSLYTTLRLYEESIDKELAKTFHEMEALKANIEEHYIATLITTFLFILVILLFAAILAHSIYRNIQKLIHELSDIVTKKTNEYQELARQLEYKVNKEVIKNREKDQIMYQHARLAAMGEMIGNIAHQWRQPLNALTVLIQSFEIKSMGGKLTPEFIEQQVKEGLRLANQMSTTIEDFKNFFSPHKEREHFGVVEALEETLELVELFLKDEHIDIQLIAKEEIRVYGYANEFSQVILNLLNNARDNFKHKRIQKDRRIVIRVERRQKPTPMVVVTFTDNGGGIDENIIDRIFEPYFTTKHKSTGTGIGLYMSKQIIEKQMHGLLTTKNITSTLGMDKEYRCAQFTITIPL